MTFMASPTALPSQNEMGRAVLNLACKLRTQAFECAATVADLSFDGAGIVVPSDLALGDAGRIWHLEIADLGSIEVLYRWESGDRIGVSFLSSQGLRDRLAVFFSSKGIAPCDDLSLYGANGGA